MTNKFIDFHSHFNGSFSRDIDAIPSFRLAVEDIPPYLPKIWAGIHPWDVELGVNFTDEISQVESQLIGIGEIGLDYYWNSSNIEQQKILFIEQMRYANKNSLPVTIHCVRAYNDLLNILRTEKVSVPTVLHGFIGSLQMAQDFLKEGCYFSFGSAAFSSQRSSQVMTNIPLDKIFVESDDSQTDIRELYRLLAELRGLDMEELKQQITINFKKIIGDE